MRGLGKAALATLVAAAVLAPAAPVSAADATRAAEWHLSTLKVGTAHKITQGRGVTVAIIDTGVFVHEDLKDRVLAGIDYTTPAGGDGRIDTDGHGTWIAGLISGRGHGSGLGMLGVAPSARILPIRVAAARSAWPTNDTIAKGIAFARKKGAKIIHLPAMAGDQATMDAVAKAVAAGVMIVAGTGNTTYDKQIMPPGAWPGVVAVTGTDKAGKFAPLYVAGAKVEFSAPGVGVITTDKVAGKYVTPNSTGVASAVTAGVAALVWAKYPKFKIAEVLQAMRTGAVDKGTKGRDSQYGHGVVNAANALAAAAVMASPSPSPSPSLSLSPTPAEEATESAAAEAPPASDAKDTQSGSLVATFGIAGGVVFLLLLAAMVVLLIRRAQSGGATPATVGGPPPTPWAPQQVQLPPPVQAAPHQPMRVQTVPVQAPYAGTPPQPGVSGAQHAAYPGMLSERTQPHPTLQQPLPQPPAPPQPQPMVHRAPVDAEALNQPTVAIPRPRFAFPGESTAADPSIYDTANFPIIEDDRR
ncbi:MAG: S8 family serine peptidase [Hamadaea sp.]|nr:S8 family serine peptidase [Hamadaea sp.]